MAGVLRCYGCRFSCFVVPPSVVKEGRKWETDVCGSAGDSRNHPVCGDGVCEVGLQKAKNE